MTNPASSLPWEKQQEEPSGAPLKLPMLTFLTGFSNCGQHELAAAICARDPNLMLEDLQAPLRSATLELFYNGDMTRELPHNDPDTYGSLDVWLMQLEGLIRGESLNLGLLAHRRLTQFGEINSVFDRILFRDCTNLDDIAPFLHHYGPSNILLIHCGSLTDPLAHSPLRKVWLAMPEVDRRMDFLAHELGVEDLS